MAFGDSLSDMGNRWLEAMPQGNAFLATWVAQLAGPGMLDDPGFKPSGTVSYFGGTNYAVAGAGTEATVALASEQTRHQHLTQQVSRRYLNPEFNKKGVRAEALHVVVIGANDVMRLSMAEEHLRTQWTELEQAGATVAESTARQLRALAQAGVRHLLWGNLFDLAQVPAVMTRATMTGPLAKMYLAAITRAVRAHNAALESAAVRLQAEFAQLEMTKFDLAAKFTDIVGDPAKYRLASVTTGADDGRHLFSSDGLHLTPRGHEIVAEHAYEMLR